MRSRAIFRQVGAVSNIHRFVVTGTKNNNGYTTKFIVQSISKNSDFSTASWSMTTLSAGTDDIVAQNGVTISTPDASFTPVIGTYTNQTVIYSLISYSTSDTYLQIATQTLSVSESTTSTQTPNLSCSFSGSTSIIYSLSGYNGGIIPSFVSIDSATGVLTIAARVSPVLRPIASTLTRRFQGYQDQSKRLLIWQLKSAQPATAIYAQSLILHFVLSAIQNLAWV